MIQNTLTIIKPDAMSRELEIIKDFTRLGYVVRNRCFAQFGRTTWEQFYAEHKGKPFFERLVEHMSSGPVMPMILTGEDAIAAYRKVLGPSDPTAAPRETLRAKYGSAIPANALHGSDSVESAAREITFFFPSEQV